MDRRKFVEMETNRISRRDFLKVSSLTVAAAVSSGAAKEVFPVEKTAEQDLGVKYHPGDDLLIRMQEDLIRALKKPQDKREWSMVIDTRKCIACQACTIACKSENATPPGVAYRRVLDISSGRYPTPKRVFVPVLCNHCENAPCVKVCPVKATKIRSDGIIDMDYIKCIGCRSCLNACPYGARQVDFGMFYTKKTPKLEEYETRANFEYKKRWSRKKGESPIGNARKCHFCLHRIEKGLLPSCTVTCIGIAIYFGDRADNLSLVAETVAENKVIRLKEKLGTKPRVYYIGIEEVEL